MRTIRVIIFCLALALIGYSCLEIVRVRQYCTTVKQVQLATSDRLNRMHEDLRQRGLNITATIPLGGDLSDLDSVKSLEPSWWVVLSLGVAMLLTEALGFVIATMTANKALQATAAVLLVSAVDGSHNAAVAGASAPPAAVPELGRWAACCVYDSASIH